MKKILFIIGLSVLANSSMAIDCSNNEVLFVENQIDTYLDHHAGAVDTVEGIHSYWIDWSLNRGYPESIEVTKTALSCLEIKGLVRQVKYGQYTLWRRF